MKSKQSTIEELLQFIKYLEAREDTLIDAMSEVKTTDEGDSTQPISKIVAGCISELDQIKIPKISGATAKLIVLSRSRKDLPNP